MTDNAYIVLKIFIRSNTTSVKHNKAKASKMKYACT